MTFDAFDVAVVPFPFTDIDAGRRRPALVVSNSAFNDAHAVVVLSMITSAGRAGWPSDIPITNTAHAGLRVESVVRLKLFTLDRVLVLRRIGALDKRDRAAAAKLIRAHLL